MRQWPAWAFELPWNVISKFAKSHSLDPLLIGAICQAESGGQQWATRYEPGYRWLFKVEQCAKLAHTSIHTEEAFQKVSWGVMQVMGAVARELGFQSALPKLCVLSLGVEYGCKHFKNLFLRFKTVEGAIAAYNAGSPRDVAPKDGIIDNQAYVDKVLGFYADLGGAIATK